MKAADFKLVVASGPTREWLDPVRFLSNASSGKTGWELASAGLNLFKSVTLISGPVESRYRTIDGACNIAVESTADMLKAVSDSLCDYSLLIMAAAPADFTPQNVSSQKIKKSGASATIVLKPTDDILLKTAQAAANLTKCYRIGFAAETENVIANARQKLEKKELNYICANRVYRNRAGFGEIENSWTVIGSSEEFYELGPAPKARLASDLLELLIEKLD